MGQAWVRRGGALALGLLGAALALGGCIFLTPPTGLRIGDHRNEYPPSSGAGAVALRRYTAPDFEILVPELWPARPLIDVVNPQGTVAQRVSYGISFSDAPGEEGLIVSTILVPGLSDADLFENARTIARTAVLQGEILADEAASLGNQPGRLVEVAGGDPVASADVNLMVAAASHKGFGYLVVLRTIRPRYEALRPIFVGMLERFAFLDGRLPEMGIGAPHPELDATQTAAIQEAIASAQAQAAASAAERPASPTADPRASAPGPDGAASPALGDRPATAGL